MIQELPSEQLKIDVLYSNVPLSWPKSFRCLIDIYVDPSVKRITNVEIAK